MPTALVTGATGFIGGHLARHLVERGYRVRCLVRSRLRCGRLEPLGVELSIGDVTDPAGVAAAVEGMDVVFNLAGLTCALSWQQMADVNIRGPAIVAEACAHSSRPPLHILVSSLSAAGPAPLDGCLAETDPPQPISQYGRSKLGGEHEALRYADRVPTTIVRPGVVFGPYDPGMRPVVQSIWRWRLHLNPGSHSPRLSLIHVDDLCRVIIAAAEKGERAPSSSQRPGEGIYFAVGHPQYPTYVELGQMIATGLFDGRRTVRVIRVPTRLAWLIGWTNEGLSRVRRRPDLLNRDKIREGTAPSWVCSGEKIRQQFSFQPAAPLEQQLHEVARWYVEAGWV
ncbi:MAG: epimerase [Pirellulaceae bacterium]|nr:MAG: epimerase [Pirellulaceae bacterium]GIW93377.1 MAG: epimerase [Pirellulaceae bacterium]